MQQSDRGQREEKRHKIRNKTRPDFSAGEIPEKEKNQKNMMTDGCS